MRRGRRHYRRPWLDGLPRFGNLFGILGEIGEIDLEAADVAGIVSRGAFAVLCMGLLNVLFRGLGLTLLRRAYLASLALGLQSGGLVDEQTIDLQEDCDALVGACWRGRRDWGLRYGLDGRLRLRRLALHLGRKAEVHGLLLAVG